MRDDEIANTAARYRRDAATAQRNGHRACERARKGVAGPGSRQLEPVGCTGSAGSAEAVVAGAARQSQIAGRQAHHVRDEMWCCLRSEGDPKAHQHEASAGEVTFSAAGVGALATA